MSFLIRTQGFVIASVQGALCVRASVRGAHSCDGRPVLPGTGARSRHLEPTPGAAVGRGRPVYPPPCPCQTRASRGCDRAPVSNSSNLLLPGPLVTTDTHCHFSTTPGPRAVASVLNTDRVWQTDTER